MATLEIVVRFEDGEDFGTVFEACRSASTATIVYAGMVREERSAPPPPPPKSPRGTTGKPQPRPGHRLVDLYWAHLSSTSKRTFTSDDVERWIRNSGPKDLSGKPVFSPGNATSVCSLLFRLGYAEKTTNGASNGRKAIYEVVESKRGVKIEGPLYVALTGAPPVRKDVDRVARADVARDLAQAATRS